MECLERQRQESEYHAALICSVIHNCSGHAEQAKSPEDFMRTFLNQKEWKRMYDDAYLRERGFTDSQFAKYEVGRSKFKKDYITFLVRNSNASTACIAYLDSSEYKIFTHGRYVKSV